MESAWHVRTRTLAPAEYPIAMSAYRKKGHPSCGWPFTSQPKANQLLIAAA